MSPKRKKRGKAKKKSSRASSRDGSPAVEGNGVDRRECDGGWASPLGQRRRRHRPKYSCPVCVYFVFARKESFIDHVLTHLMDDPVPTCSRCGLKKMDRRRLKEFEDDKHGCFKKGKRFRVLQKVQDYSTLTWFLEAFHCIKPRYVERHYQRLLKKGKIHFQ